MDLDYCSDCKYLKSYYRPMPDNLKVFKQFQSDFYHRCMWTGNHLEDLPKCPYNGKENPHHDQTN